LSVWMYVQIYRSRKETEIKTSYPFGELFTSRSLDPGFPRWVFCRCSPSRERCRPCISTAPTEIAHGLGEHPCAALPVRAGACVACEIRVGTACRRGLGPIEAPLVQSSLETLSPARVPLSAIRTEFSSSTLEDYGNFLPADTGDDRFWRVAAAGPHGGHVLLTDGKPAVYGRKLRRWQPDEVRSVKTSGSCRTWCCCSLACA
jgi:hypothetical protein